MNYRNIIIISLSFALFYTACQRGQHSDNIQNTDTVGKEPHADTDVIAGTAVISPERLVVPGKSIGKIGLNDSSEKLTSQLGPAQGGDAAMGKAWLFWYSKADSTDTTTYRTAVFTVRNMGASDEAISRVKLISITSPFLSTLSGIRIGCSLADIRHLFPDVQKVAVYTAGKSKQLSVYDDIDEGISFDIDPDDICRAITVHEPGKEVSGFYTGLHPDGYKKW